jgi:hypothetical protein
MRYSYAWAVTVGELRELLPMSLTRWPYGAFVRVRGRILDKDYEVDGTWLDVGAKRYPVSNALLLTFRDASDGHHAKVLVSKRWVGTRCEQDSSFTGRLGGLPWTAFEPADNMTIDATSPRLVPQSIAGLVVGAMGLFVFAAALRHWLERRRMLD